MLLRAAVLGFSLVLIVSTGWAAEPICPNGSNPRADITKCMDFESLANCTTGWEDLCWQDNGYAGQVGTRHEFGHVIVGGTDAAVGSGYSRGRPEPGGTGAGYNAIEPVPGFPSNAMNFRYYIRFTRGYLSFLSGHNVQMETSGTNGACGTSSSPSAIKFQLSTYTGATYYPLSCGPRSYYLTPNKGQSVVLLNNRWYAIEVHGTLDTTWTPRIDSTLSLTATAGSGTLTLTRASGSFVDDGWVADSQNRYVMTTGFTGNNNNQWHISSVSALTMVLESQLNAGALTTETVSGRLRSLEVHDGNGIVRVWIDGTLVTEYTDLNMGSAVTSGGLHWGSRILAPEMYYHFTVPPWSFEIDYDNVAISNTGTYIGCANTDGSTGCPGTAENPAGRGTGDTSSPYANIYGEMNWMGHRAADDCVVDGAPSLGTGQVYRTGGTLQTTIAHGLYPDKCNTPPHQDQALEISLSSTNSGGGASFYRQDTVRVFQQWASYGWVYIPSGMTVGNDLALSGFMEHDYYADAEAYVAMSISGGNWAVGVRDTAGVMGSPNTTATAVTFDTWHEYEIVLWNNGAGACANANGCVSLMIDRQRLLTAAPLSKSAAWMFTQGNQPAFIVGVIDFRGMAPFTVYFDDNTIASVSSWSADGWGAASNPFDLGRLKLMRGVSLGRGAKVQ